MNIQGNVPVAKLSKKIPEINEPVFYTGYPLGLYAPGIIHRFFGTFSGVEPSYGSSVWTFPAVEGSSGSPVYNKNSELIGIISSVAMGFPHIVMGPGIEEILSLLENAP